MRLGVTRWENRLAKAFSEMGIPALRNYVVCFECGKYWRNSTPGHYPSFCKKCNHAFDQPLLYTMPDFVVEGKNSIVVVYVDGQPHDNSKQKQKDILQRTILYNIGYRVVTVRNSLIDSCEDTWLRVIANGIAYMADNATFYKAVSDNETELPGMGRLGGEFINGN